jgi:pSer/pThr/pTyr-binding forkhead associated (FHA) protein
MGFALRYRERDFPLGEGRFMIGRSEDCQLRLDDPLASRNHAVLIINANDVALEDLESRNGVFVNQRKLNGRTVLSHGDRLRIGTQELILLDRGAKKGAETLVQRRVTEGFDTLGVLGGLADKALSMGRTDEAERILSRQLLSLLGAAEQERELSEEIFSKASDFAFRLVSVSGRGSWLDYLFRLYAAHQRLMDADMVNELYALAPKIQGTSPAHLRGYLASLKDEVSQFGPGDRFVIKRLEGLQALLR